MIRLKCITGEIVELDSSSLSGANLGGLELHRLIARCQNFSCANMAQGKLRNAILHHSNFADVNFENANLINVEAFACNFVSARFEKSRLIGGQFNWSRFDQATLDQADVGGACFEGCSLIGTDFSGALRVDQANFSNALFDESTMWPPGFVPVGAELLADMDGRPWGP